MKEVLQHGVIQRWKMECTCGCVFTYDDNDIYYNLTTDIVQCPECKRNLKHKDGQVYNMTRSKTDVVLSCAEV